MKKQWFGLTRTYYPISENDWTIVTRRLEEINLLTVEPDGSIDAHPLLREYFANCLRKENPKAWRVVHRRLYRHLCATTKDGRKSTLEDLQLLSQAVAHGCQGGLQQDACDKVYFRRIKPGEQAYLSNPQEEFGAKLRAIACFFDSPWTCVSPTLTKVAQYSVLDEAAYCLRTLGRLTEATEPMRAVIAMGVKQEDWEAASINCRILVELELALGDVAAAIRDGEQAVTYANISREQYWRMVNLVTYADALHQASREAEAAALFLEAEQIQAENQPQFPLLLSPWGFRYCDLLLADVEREAAKPNTPTKSDTLLAQCGRVLERGVKMLKWRNKDAPLHVVGFDYLTLGRVALYTAILESHDLRRQSNKLCPSSPRSEGCLRTLTTAAANLDLAVSHLRYGGQKNHLPRGLLTRAWLRSVTGKHTGPDSAQSDLDEAWEVAERGPMPLFLADVHLYRARLFLREPEYPWDKSHDGTPRGPECDLAEAKRIINKCGYHRRDAELADAKVALSQLGSTAAAVV